MSNRDPGTDDHDGSAARPHGGCALTVRLPRDRRCGALARRRIEELLRGVAAGATVGAAKVVVTELVNNAVVHGAGAIELRAHLRGDRLRVEVVDEGERRADRVRRRAGGEDGGWGLQIVERLCTDWGAFEGTTHVWADLPLAR